MLGVGMASCLDDCILRTVSISFWHRSFRKRLFFSWSEVELERETMEWTSFGGGVTSKESAHSSEASTGEQRCWIRVRIFQLAVTTRAQAGEAALSASMKLAHDGGWIYPRPWSETNVCSVTSWTFGTRVVFVVYCVVRSGRPACYAALR